MPAAATAADLIAGFAAGQPRTRLSSPAIHFTSRYAKTYKRLARLLGSTAYPKEASA
jgi:hypothetical protein